MVKLEGISNTSNKIVPSHFKTELMFKVLVVGDFGVGKTSIIRRYSEGVFSSTYKITIGADFAVKTIEWDNDTRITLQLWDVAGHERFGCLTGVYYRYASSATICWSCLVKIAKIYNYQRPWVTHKWFMVVKVLKVAAVIVFDLTRPETFTSVEKWLRDLRDKATLPNGKPVPVILLANKGDISVSVPPQIVEFCKHHNILAWYITSAKENANIAEAMEVLLKTVVENHKNNFLDSGQHESLILTPESTQKEKRIKCCQK